MTSSVGIGAQVEMPASGSAQVPLCVDLDGTLLHVDSLHEGVLQLLARKPLHALLIPIWLLSGRARLKQEVARRTELDVAYLPFNQSLLDYLRGEKDDGRQLILVTGADRWTAEAVSRHLGLFEDVIASDGTRNLSGRTKAGALRDRFGRRGFDYAGNSRSDRHVWACARRAIVAGRAHCLRADAADLGCPLEAKFPSPKPSLWKLFAALRPHQWTKNLLLAVPLLAAHRFSDVGALMEAARAFVAMSLMASSLYLVNDLLDLPADRRHASKRFRGFASGHLPVAWGVLGAPVAATVSLALGATVQNGFLNLLALYALCSLGYSSLLKSIAILDVVVLSMLYVLRLFAGGVATETELSFWLLSFAMFFFFNLAVLKRYSELLAMSDGQNVTVARRGYMTADIEIVGMLGTGSGLVSVLVLALYINSASVAAVYRSPQLIWLLCPILMYWIGHVWLVARRGRMHHDPVVFAFSDPISLGVCLVGLLILGAAA